MIVNKILKSKRGVAIENAILFIIVIFMLCALLSSITLIAHYQFKIDNTVLENDVDLDQIGEDFIAFIEYNAEPENPVITFDEFLKNVTYPVGEGASVNADYDRIYNPYDCVLTETSITVKYRNSDVVLLYVETAVVDEKITVTAWNYTAPETPSDPET